MKSGTSRALGALILGILTFSAFSGAALAADLPAGKMETITVHGAALAGNLSGDTADRKVYVYLPPDYATHKRERFPVIYFLHGFAQDADFYARTLGWPQTIDRGLATASLPGMIVVMPDAMTPYGGSMYSNSITTGDWEAFVAKDLVTYIDQHYRTLPVRAARGLSGHSMGGYGTLRIAMKYPQVFGSLYAMSACCLDPRGASPRDGDMEKVANMADVAAITPVGRTTLAASAAWSPNAQRPPFFFDLPVREGKTQPDVIARYAANAPVAMVSQYAPQMKSFKAIMMDVGLQDPLLKGNVMMHEALLRVGVAHEYVNYEGDHVNRIPERFEKNVLPWFAKQLVFKR
jgi:enterochelin esterase-like enzyme